MNSGYSSVSGRTAPLSVFIPTLNEAAVLGNLFADLNGMSVAREIIVVDGGSQDTTRDIARSHGATVLSASRGRGAQLAAGAAAARAPLQLFLDADARLYARAIALLAPAFILGIFPSGQRTVPGIAEHNAGNRSVHRPVMSTDNNAIG